ncbi:FmdB family zinc ribbon protein [Saccharothrix isguenensis]
MPTYQYACTECDHRFDAVQSFSDSALTDCPQCSGRLRKLYGAVGVVFKGSGFYRTDSRSSSSGAPAAAKSDSTPAKAESSSSSTSTSSSSSSSSSSSTPAAAAS